MWGGGLMPEIAAFLVNETLHQGLFFIYVSSPARCFTEPLALQTKAISRAADKACKDTKLTDTIVPTDALCHRVQTPPPRGAFWPVFPRCICFPALRPRNALGACSLTRADSNAAAVRLGSAEQTRQRQHCLISGL